LSINHNRRRRLWFRGSLVANTEHRSINRTHSINRSVVGMLIDRSHKHATAEGGSAAIATCYASQEVFKYLVGTVAT